MSEPAFRAVEHDYAAEISHQAEMIAKKPAIEKMYRRFHGKILTHLSPHEPTVELGSGAVGLKRLKPGVIATDAIAHPWTDRVVDACAMPFAEASVGNLTCLDVMHHLPVPLNFLREAERVLIPGGRLVVLEPWGSWWGRLVFGYLHHEPFTLRFDAFRAEPPPNIDPTNFSNQAIPTLMFGSKAAQAKLRDLVPGLRIIRQEFSDFLIYPLTGGHNAPQLIPTALLGPLCWLEDRLLWPVAKWLTGLRCLTVLERT